MEFEQLLLDLSVAIDGNGWRGRVSDVLEKHGTVEPPPPPPPPPPVTVAVPNVVGLSEAEAGLVVIAAGLVVGSVVNPGGGDPVISQSPSAGTIVDEGSAVGFTVGVVVVPPPPPPTGDHVHIPSVIGLTEAAAQTVIVNAGLVVGTVTNSGGGGEVTSQSPAAGGDIEVGSAINFTVGTEVPPPPPPTNPTVPNIVGLSESAARTAITDAGLVVGTVVNPGGGGGVSAQDPSAGTQVALGSIVTFTVAIFNPPPPPPPPGPGEGNLAYTLIEADLRPSTFVEVLEGDQVLSGRVEGVRINGDAHLANDTTLIGCEVSGAIIAGARPTLIDTAYGVGWSQDPRDAGKRRAPEWMNSFSQWNAQTDTNVTDGYMEGVVAYGPDGQGAYQLHNGLTIVRSIFANLNPTINNTGTNYHSVGSSNGPAVNCNINDVRYILIGAATGFISYMADWGPLSKVITNRAYFDSSRAEGSGADWYYDVQAAGSEGSTKAYPISGMEFNDCLHGPDKLRSISKTNGYGVTPGCSVRGAHLLDGTPV